mmetsp:Transcript_14571/g.31912  ORF Transcript_14571/g.31912 Transcript_14571/m.31912 type:complete len:346 (-) Transcript_14571:74-1111(-)
MGPPQTHPALTFVFALYHYGYVQAIPTTPPSSLDCGFGRPCSRPEWHEPAGSGSDAVNFLQLQVDLVQPPPMPNLFGLPKEQGGKGDLSLINRARHDAASSVEAGRRTGAAGRGKVKAGRGGREGARANGARAGAKGWAKRQQGKASSAHRGLAEQKAHGSAGAAHGKQQKWANHTAQEKAPVKAGAPMKLHSKAAEAATVQTKLPANSSAAAAQTMLAAKPKERAATVSRPATQQKAPQTQTEDDEMPSIQALMQNKQPGTMAQRPPAKEEDRETDPVAVLEGMALTSLDVAEHLLMKNMRNVFAFTCSLMLLAMLVYGFLNWWADVERVSSRLVTQRPCVKHS